MIAWSWTCRSPSREKQSNHDQNYVGHEVRRCLPSYGRLLSCPPYRFAGSLRTPVVHRHDQARIVGSSREDGVAATVDELPMTEGRVPRGVVALDRQLQGGTCLEERGRGPDLDVQGHDVARPQLFDPGMAVPWAQRRAARCVQLPV